MGFFVISMLTSTVFYVIALYMSYIVSFDLYIGIKYKLIRPIIISVGFILFCYISIISDIILFSYLLYLQIALKNGFFSIIVITSLFKHKKS